MIFAVVGSREFGQIDQIPAFLDYIRKGDPNMSIVSGGADGVDKAAEQWAASRGVPCKVFPANWEEDGDRAGIKRNADIIAAAEMALVFWDGESAGTLDSLCRGMKKKGMEVRVFLG